MRWAAVTQPPANSEKDNAEMTAMTNKWANKSVTKWNVIQITKQTKQLSQDKEE